MVVTSTAISLALTALLFDGEMPKQAKFIPALRFNSP
jgi:hypothetical protein